MRFRGALLLPLLRFARLAPLALLPLLACAPPPRLGETAATALRADTIRVKLDPTVSAPHFVPIAVSDEPALGVEPGGGARSIEAGVRTVSLPGGGVVAAGDRLPGSRWEVVALPDRLGGGFLFRVEDKSVWRAEKWLGPARPIYASGLAITRIVPGLDRVYLLSRGWRAIDGQTGEPRPLGPWPTSPTIGAYAAADGWRALAIADLRGVVATSDAGATWRTVALPLEAKDVFVRGDSLVLKGTEAGRADVSYELRPDGQTIRLGEAPLARAEQDNEPARGGARSASAETSAAPEPPGPLGPHPLVSVVDDGWPLEDGTALVARDGTLSRVRLDDGTIVETAPGAFPLRPSRCHPVPLGPAGGLGFVCGEPRGATILYSFDAAHGKMVEARRFESPRVVVTSGNGAIVVRGSCDSRGAGDGGSAAHRYCVRTRDGVWSELRLEGAVGDERVTVLADGRFAIVSPPRASLDSARITVIDKGKARSAPIVFTDVRADVARVLDVGVWLDGIEERRPGVLGGWIEAAGTMLGFELTLDGSARVGALVRGESSLPMVSGRYGLGWSVAHGGHETTDGGMTWTSIPVPDPVSPPRAVTSRACGPVGCSAAGWLRIGWGTAPDEPAPAPHQAVASAPRSRLSLPLECDTVDVSAGRKAPPGREDVLGAPPAAVGAGDARVFTFDTSDTLGHGARNGLVGRIYAWGAKSADWEHGAKWMVRWDWPFGGSSDVRSSLPSSAPGMVLDAARAGSSAFFSWNLALGDDPSHALLVTRRSVRSEGGVFELEADHAPLEIRRPNGEPIGELDAAVRAAGRWYLATPPPPSQTGQTSGRTEAIVWQVDGPVARELARIPRIARDARSSTVLALRADGRALGYVVDGQPMGDRNEPTRWVAAIDLDTGVVGDIEPLGSFDFGDRTAIAPCANDDLGWSMDLPLDRSESFPISLAAQGTPMGGLHGALGRVRLGSAQMCVERLAGFTGTSIDAVARSPRAPAPRTSITVAVGDGRGRRVFRCGVR